MQAFPGTSSRPAGRMMDMSVFTILGGTTIPGHAAIVRESCREGSRVELRAEPRTDDAAEQARVEVWLKCDSLFGLRSEWRKIGHVPDEAAMALPPSSSSVIGYGTVRTVYAPTGRDEAVVTVKIQPQ